ncbi:uncharacterized protein ColSpa_07944 [Colletotrichum spaethianum]|uniref:Aminoglycoside phosphotransferase domain-containing protein n=1 Tax=Colletotrichum spaethianum TaxID=700344 RepID=A0AA37URC4_9PEZI|nr:uncharacterized protein ColSpa_07944 [Colletotrichum spaethianum]GKT47763.1 hypothetical protein ColSpa_07944 [Colletotrichum spaethianum]
MSDFYQNCLVPDITVLSGISELNDITVCKYRIISNNFDTCTFVAYFEEEQSPRGLPTDLLIRIEKRQDDNPLFVTAALQRLAHIQLPHLVPKVWGSGHTQTETGTMLSYMLSQFYVDSCTLESVWDDMDKSSQQSLVVQTFSALFQLQDVYLANINDEAKKLLQGTPFEATDVERPVLVGGPAYGYFHDVASFLMATMSPGNARYNINEKPDGALAIQLHPPQEVAFGFAQTDLDLLAHMLVLCHNDLEPRNILVRRAINSVGKAVYELVAIIDWEMAGFFPFAFEVGHKDTCLGLQNQSWTWYSLYRQIAGRVLSETHPGARPIWSKLIRAMVVTDISRKDSNRLNVGNLVQKLWHEREKTDRYQDFETGYTRKPDVEVAGPFTVADNAELELVALRKLGYID